jgi:hypothetical protein
MALANMRATGVRSLSVTCELCRHEALMNVDAFDDATPVLQTSVRAWSAPAAESSAHLPGRIGRSERSGRTDRLAVAAVMKDIVLVTCSSPSPSMQRPARPDRPVRGDSEAPPNRGGIDDKENQFRVAALVILGAAGRGTA